jgi:DNA-3-methyladenine glycosylase II
MRTPRYWSQACAELAGRDAVMATLIETYPRARLRTRGDPFATLARSIVGQQISVLAAEAVWQRVALACGQIDPERIIALDASSLRTAGLSGRKVEYLKDLAAHFTSGAVKPRRWLRMNDEEIIAELTQVRGVGRWTVEMFLIFYLRRPNVFPVADIGLVRAIEAQYYAGQRLTVAQVRGHAERWAPWNSVATWYLWRSLDPMIVEY